MALKIHTSLPRVQTPACLCLRRLQSGRRRAQSTAACVLILLIELLMLSSFPLVGQTQPGTSGLPTLGFQPNVNFTLTNDTTSRSRLIDFISKDPQKWVFIKFVSIDSPVSLRISHADKATDDSGKVLENGKWYGFLGNFTLDLQLQPSDSGKSGSLDLRFDLGKADLEPRASREEAIKSISTNGVRQDVINQLIRVSWMPAEGWVDDATMDILKFFGKVIGVLAVLGVLFLMVRFKVWNKVWGWVRRRAEGRQAGGVPP